MVIKHDVIMAVENAVYHEVTQLIADGFLRYISITDREILAHEAAVRVLSILGHLVQNDDE